MEGLASWHYEFVEVECYDIPECTSACEQFLDPLLVERVYNKSKRWTGRCPLMFRKPECENCKKQKLELVKYHEITCLTLVVDGVTRLRDKGGKNPMRGEG